MRKITFTVILSVFSLLYISSSFGATRGQDMSGLEEGGGGRKSLRSPLLGTKTKSFPK